jgi:hypothetical protein
MHLRPVSLFVRLKDLDGVFFAEPSGSGEEVEDTVVTPPSVFIPLTLKHHILVCFIPDPTEVKTPICVFSDVQSTYREQPQVVMRLKACDALIVIGLVSHILHLERDIQQEFFFILLVFIVSLSGVVLEDVLAIVGEGHEVYSVVVLLIVVNLAVRMGFEDFYFSFFVYMVSPGVGTVLYV